jgi:hypothetical protein
VVAVADLRIDDPTRAAIRNRAQELADQAPPLTAQQILLLRFIFANRTGGDGA